MRLRLCDLDKKWDQSYTVYELVHSTNLTSKVKYIKGLQCTRFVSMMMDWFKSFYTTLHLMKWIFCKWWMIFTAKYQKTVLHSITIFEIRLRRLKTSVDFGLSLKTCCWHHTFDHRYMHKQRLSTCHEVIASCTTHGRAVLWNVPTACALKFD